jgi:hypothetical protein
LRFRCFKDEQGRVKSEFKMYQDPAFKTIVFSKEELYFWNKDADHNFVKFPHIVTMVSVPELHSILLSLPQDPFPPLAKRKDGWEEAIEKSKKECLKDCYSFQQSSKRFWEVFFGSAERETGLYAVCSGSDLWQNVLRPTLGIQVIPPDLRPSNDPMINTTATAGQVMTSTLAANSNRHPLNRNNQLPVLGPLQSSAFAFIKVDGEFSTSTGLEVCVVQLPDFPSRANTTDPALDVMVKWWKPVDRTVNGKWVVWMTEGKGRRQQWVSPVKRGTVVVASIELQQSSKLDGPLKDRKLKVKASSLAALN